MTESSSIDAMADSFGARLVATGLEQAERGAKGALFSRALAALGDRRDDVRAWWVPGRVEFLGKHTDYAGGPSLLCAVERGFAVVASPRPDACVRILDAQSRQQIDGELKPDLVVRQAHWSNYPLTVCRRVARNFPGAAHGVDLAFASDLPSAAGLSSSSAFLVATFLAVADANDLSTRAEYRDAIRNAEDLAGYLGAVENGGGFRTLAGDRGVGTQGGSEDHTAILCGRPGALVQYAFAPIRFERSVPVPNGYVFVIAASGVIAPKTGSARERYNRASSQALEALDAWRAATGSAVPTLAAALGESPDAMDRLRDVLREQRELLDRVEQFQTESEIVRAAGDALALGDLDRLGTLVDRSQESADRLLGNQVPETVALARRARELGAAAASAFGAGFGGSVYALVRASEADEFLRRWATQYTREFPTAGKDAKFFISRAGPAAMMLDG
jgi:galactokinase